MSKSRIICTVLFMKATEAINMNSNYTVTVGPFPAVLTQGSVPPVTMAGVGEKQGWAAGGPQGLGRTSS